MSMYPDTPGTGPRHPLGIPGPLSTVAPSVGFDVPLTAAAPVMQPPVLRCRVTLTTTAKGTGQVEVMQELEAGASETAIQAALERLLRAALAALTAHGIPLAGAPKGGDTP